MTKHKKILLSLTVVIAAAAAIGAGTFATFTAQTRNPGNVFATGTLVLSNTKQGGSACLSTGAGTNTDTNVNNGCDQLVNLTVKKPGDTGSANLTIKNDGSVSATALKVFEAACANSDAAGESYHGSGNPCSQVQLYIQQYSDSGFATPSACLYGAATSNTCNFSDATKTLADFNTNYSTSTNGLAIGSGLAAGASNYFKVAVQLPSTADNTFQGRQASFDLTWFAQS